MNYCRIIFAAVWTVNSIVSIFTNYFDLLVDSWDPIWLFVVNSWMILLCYSIAHQGHHCSDAPRRELPREPLPTNRAKAPIQTSAHITARLLLPTVAIMSSGHDLSDPNSVGIRRHFCQKYMHIASHTYIGMCRYCVTGSRYVQALCYRE